ncbi:MAG: hypothetical protein ABIY71_10455, partial [Flavobacteriales bacterium]
CAKIARLGGCGKLEGLSRHKKLKKASSSLLLHRHLSAGPTLFVSPLPHYDTVFFLFEPFDAPWLNAASPYESVYHVRESCP